MKHILLVLSLIISPLVQASPVVQSPKDLGFSKISGNRLKVKYSYERMETFLDIAFYKKVLTVESCDQTDPNNAIAKLSLQIKGDWADEGGVFYTVGSTTIDLSTACNGSKADTLILNGTQVYPLVEVEKVRDVVYELNVSDAGNQAVLASHISSSFNTSFMMFGLREECPGTHEFKTECRKVDGRLSAIISTQQRTKCTQVFREDVDTEIKYNSIDLKTLCQGEAPKEVIVNGKVAWSAKPAL